MWLEILIGYLMIHIFCFFVLSRLIIPYLGFRKTPIEKDIPKPILDKIEEIKKSTKNKEEFTKAAFMFLSKRYKSLWLHTLLRLDVVLLRDLSKIWNQPAFLPCNSHNHLLRIFLVKSRYYKDSQIKIRHCFLNFGIHQYLRITDNGRTFDLDLWGHSIGVPYGKHASWFRPTSLLTDVTELLSHYKKHGKI